MSQIRVRDGESIDEALRRFKRACERDGIIKDLRKKRFHEPPSVIKQRRMKDAARRARKRARYAAKRLSRSA